MRAGAVWQPSSDRSLTKPFRMGLLHSDKMASERLCDRAFANTPEALASIPSYKENKQTDKQPFGDHELVRVYH